MAGFAIYLFFAAIVGAIGAYVVFRYFVAPDMDSEDQMFVAGMILLAAGLWPITLVLAALATPLGLGWWFAHRMAKRKGGKRRGGC